MLSGVLVAWREVKGLTLALVACTLGLALLRRWKLTLLMAMLLGWLLYFFRDPERTSGSSSPEWILAAADGKITHIELINEPHFFQGPAWRVSMFLSLFDVHVQRSPYQGKVQFLRYQSGSFAPAFWQDTQANEYNLLGLLTPHGPLAIKQIAGILARRIVCWPGVGDYLASGQRLGLIKFGSRVDVLLPPQVEIVVHLGQQTYGGQTIIGRWPQ